MRFRWAALGLAGLGVAAALVPRDAQSAREQVTLGKEIYMARCAECHGEQGQGDKAPPLVGPNHNLTGYGTAQGLFEYTKQVMPADRPGRLLEAEYWAVLAYILDENQLLPDGVTSLGKDNAPQVPVHH
jgi:mono/diheme cytochrome c family protein